MQVQETLTPKKRSAAVVSAHLIMIQNGTLLLSLRKNTGYCDGMWNLPSGHVEDNEPATQAMVREAHEELGIELIKMQVCHIMHLHTDRSNVAIFIACDTWNGDLQNQEPDKCEKIAFFPLNDLPSNIIPYMSDAIESIAKGEFYSEQGWD